MIVKETYHPDILNIVARALKPAAHCNDEAFEMKVLRLMDTTSYSIFVEKMLEDQIRFTLPVDAESNLRLRVWLKRVYRPIDAEDTKELDRLISVIRKAMPNIPTVYAKNYNQLHLEDQQNDR